MPKKISSDSLYLFNWLSH